MFQESLQNVFISGNIDIASLTFYYSWVSAGLWKPSWNQYFVPIKYFCPNWKNATLEIDVMRSATRKMSHSVGDTGTRKTLHVLWLITGVGLQRAESYNRRPPAHLLPPPFLLLIWKRRAAPVQHQKLPPECFLSWALRKSERKNNQTRADQYFLTFTHSPSRGEERIRFIAADTIHQNPSRSEVLLGTTLLKRML